MWIAADDIETYLATTEAEEEEATGDAVDDDVKGIVGGNNSMKGGISNCCRERLPWGMPCDGGIAPERGCDGIGRLRGHGSSLVNPRGLDAGCAGYFEESIAILTELLLAEGKGGHGCLTTARGGLLDFDGAVM